MSPDAGARLACIQTIGTMQLDAWYLEVITAETIRLMWM